MCIFSFWFNLWPLFYLHNFSAILTHARAVYINNNDITMATNHLKVLGLLKREFRTIRAAWTKQCELVQGYDEVAMAKRRSDASIKSNNEDCFNNVFLQVNDFHFIIVKKYE